MEVGKKDLKVELFIKIDEGNDVSKGVIILDMESAEVDNVPVCGSVKRIKVDGITVKDAIYLEAVFRFLSDYIKYTLEGGR